jgi:hypothetical protein
MATTRPSGITSPEEFQQALRALVADADSNGVDVRGNWPVYEPGVTPGWDIDIVELSRAATLRRPDTE